MRKRICRSISAAVFAALIAAAATIFPGASDPVIASAPIHGGKDGRSVSRPLGTPCSQQTWPYYQADCLRDRRIGFGQTTAVRVVTTDRIERSDR